MNTVSKFALIVALSLSSYSFALPGDYSIENPNAISSEISQMLNQQALELDQGASFQISFIVNKKNQIVITDIESEDSTLIDFVKQQLNYKELKTLAKHNQRYFLPITFQISKD